MRLLKLELFNFKGAKEFTFEPNGHNADIYGSNGTGKTTLFDALTWLLYNKASDADVQDFSPKTADPNGNEIHNLDNTVRGTFRLEDGSIIILTKTMSEDWTAKRGSPVKTFSGNRTTYAIDDVPCNQTEFMKRVTAICSADKAQILTRPLFFSSALHWSVRRQILLEICGDISDLDIIRNDPNLSGLLDYLHKPGPVGLYTVEEFQKIAQARRKALDEKMQELPKRIDEASRGLPDLEGLDEEALSAEKEDLKAQKAELHEQIAMKSASSASADLRRKIESEEQDLEHERRAFRLSVEDRLRGRRTSIAMIEQARDSEARKVRQLENDILSKSNSLESAKAQRERLTAEYKEIRASVPSVDQTCPCCGQALPADKVASAIEQFNLDKAQKLEHIRGIIESSCSKDRLAQLAQSISDLEYELAETRAKVEQYTVDIGRRNAEISDVDAESYEQSPEYQYRKDHIDALRKQLADSSNDFCSEIINGLKAKIQDIDSAISGIDEKLLNFGLHRRLMMRVNELNEEQVKAGQEYEHLEHGLYLCEQFIKTKVDMLTDRINEHFASVRFRLFDQQINGGVKECCEVLVPTRNGLKLYKDANAAAQINAGLEIINALSKAWHVEMPVFVDNAESIVELSDIDPQVIRLIVSSTDKTLRMDTQNA